MNTNPLKSSEKTFACETYQMRKKSEANPKTLMARLWRWHTGWCSGWKAYQAHLMDKETSDEDPGDRKGLLKRQSREV